MKEGGREREQEREKEREKNVGRARKGRRGLLSEVAERLRRERERKSEKEKGSEGEILLWACYRK